jgi:hypothetical protein
MSSQRAQSRRLETVDVRGVHNAVITPTRPVNRDSEGVDSVHNVEKVIHNCARHAHNI